MHWDPKVKEQDVWEWPQEVDGFPAGAAAATGSPSGRRGQCTQVTGEQLLLVPTRDSVLVLGERLGTETGHGNRLLKEVTISVSFMKIFRTKGT